VFITFSLVRKFYSFLQIRIKYFEKNELIQLFNFGFFLFLNAIAIQVVFFTDRFFIGSLVSLSAATMYALNAKVPELTRELIFRITDNAYPGMVEISTKESENKLKIIHQKLLLITVCLATITFWMIMTFSQSFIQLWVGADFFVGKSILFLASLIMIIHCVLHVSAICLMGVGLVKGFTMMSIFEAIINIGLTFWLGKKMGISGILIATIIALFLTNGWFTPYLAMKNIKINLKEYLFDAILIPLISISCLGIVVYMLCQNLFRLIQMNWINFIGLALLTTFLFVTFVWIIFLRKKFSEYIPPRFKKYLLPN
jgi:O-antigen/teichoic acid export membrane protein